MKIFENGMRRNLATVGDVIGRSHYVKDALVRLCLPENEEARLEYQSKPHWTCKIDSRNVPSRNKDPDLTIVSIVAQEKCLFLNDAGVLEVTKERSIDPAHLRLIVKGNKYQISSHFFIRKWKSLMINYAPEDFEFLYFVQNQDLRESPEDIGYLCYGDFTEARANCYGYLSNNSVLDPGSALDKLHVTLNVMLGLDKWD